MGWLSSRPRQAARLPASVESGASARAILAAGALAWLGGCVTRVVEAPPVVPVPLDMTSVVIPLGSSAGVRNANADQYYASVVGQMQQALAARELEQLLGLIGLHDRDDAPDWALERIKAFRDAALGLRFEREAERHSKVSLRGDALPIGAALQFAFRLVAPGSKAVVGGRRGGLGILVTLSIADRDAFGGSTEHRTSRILRLDRTVDLGEGEAIDLPFAVAVDAGTAVVREIRVVAELLPGSISVDGRRVPVRRVLLTERKDVFYPRNVEPIQKKPLVTLQRVVSRGDAALYPHLFLAARFMPEESVERACELLIPWVRLGRPDQARAAMACLAELTGEDIGNEDRTGWLQWWMRRTRSP